MKRVTLYIGHNVGDIPTHTTADIAAAIECELSINEYTLVPASGMWCGQAEASTVCIITGQNEAQASAIVKAIPALAKALEQQAVMCDVEEVTATLIEAQPAEQKKAN